MATKTASRNGTTKHAKKAAPKAAPVQPKEVEANDGLGELDLTELDTAEATPTPATEEGEPQTEPVDEAPAAEPAKGGKGKKAEPVAPAPDEASYTQADARYTVVDIPLGDLSPNKQRTPTEAAVGEMVRSIQKNGLLTPIIVGSDLTIVAGNTRYAAFAKMGRKTIPARVAVDPKTGEQISAAEASGHLQTMTENLVRTNMTPVQQGTAFAGAIKAGWADDAKSLATQLGLAASTVSNYIAMVERGSKKMQEALAEGKITTDAALAITTRSKTPQEQDALLDQLLQASEGKRISGKDVDAVKPKTTVSRKGRAGRKPSVATLSPEAFDTANTGIAGKLRKELPEGKGGEGGYTVTIVLELHVENGKTFARYDLEKEIQKAAAKLDASKVRTELEAQRKGLEG